MRTVFSVWWKRKGFLQYIFFKTEAAPKMGKFYNSSNPVVSGMSKFIKRLIGSLQELIDNFSIVCYKIRLFEFSQTCFYFLRMPNVVLVREENNVSARVIKSFLEISNVSDRSFVFYDTKGYRRCVSYSSHYTKSVV